MALLVINFGSSSVKFSLFLQKKRLFDLTCPHKRFDSILRKVMTDTEVKAVVHRFVHGGEHRRPLLINSGKELLELKSLIDLAPLHNPLCFEGIRKSFSLRPLPQIVIFDTAFFADLPDVATALPLPKPLLKKYQLRRYGFHGIAHEALANAVPSGKVITLQLGSGCSITALKARKPLDTSMGFTPLEGLVMGTRAGDLDPGVVALLASHEKNLTEILNHKSGLLALAGTSNMQEILKKKKSLAFDLFCYRAQKYIGAYVAALGGLDSLVFSGGIGENSSKIRALLCPSWLGAKLDARKNRTAKALNPGESKLISAKGSAIKIYVVGADENRLMAEKAFAINKGLFE